MIIDFYTDNEQKAPTVQHYLFTDDYAVIMNGQFIENEGKHYQVTSQQVLSDQNAYLAVFLKPINRRPITINL